MVAPSSSLLRAGSMLAGSDERQTSMLPTAAGVFPCAAFSEVFSIEVADPSEALSSLLESSDSPSPCAAFSEASSFGTDVSSEALSDVITALPIIIANTRAARTARAARGSFFSARLFSLPSSSVFICSELSSSLCFPARTAFLNS